MLYDISIDFLGCRMKNKSLVSGNFSVNYKLLNTV